MKASEIKLDVSPITNTIYAGKVNAKGNVWIDKHDVTEQVLSCIAHYMDGKYSEIKYPTGKLIWISKEDEENSAR